MSHNEVILLLVSYLIAFLAGSVLTWKLRGHLSDLENKLHATVKADVAAVDAKVAAVAADVKKTV
jgi:hypothetical protein